MTTILALDISTHMGWCFGSDSTDIPTFGTVHFGTDEASHAARGAACLRWCVSEFRSHPPDILPIESMLPVQAFGRKNHASAALQFGYHLIVRAVAFECGIYNIQEHSVSDVRGVCLGYRNLKREVAKPAVIKRCHQLGISVADDNQGDACLLWLYQCSLINKRKVFDRLATCGIVTITNYKKSIGPKLSKKLRM